jgi:CheY-like chemotaxis protein
MILYQLSRLEFSDHVLSVNHVSSLKELEEIKDFVNPDLILLDLGLPESDGAETFNSAKKIFPQSTIIILTGNEDDSLASFLVKNGAQDFLIKSEVDTKILKKTMQYSLERSHFQHAISDSVFKYRDLFQNSPTPLFLLNARIGSVRVINSALCAIMECSDEAALYEDLSNQLEHIITEDLLKQVNFSVNAVFKTCKSKELKVQLVGSKLKYEEGSYVCQLVPSSISEKQTTVSDQWLEELSEKTEMLKVFLKILSGKAQIDLDPAMDLLNTIEKMINTKTIDNQ